jgi:hypothetical protein
MGSLNLLEQYVLLHNYGIDTGDFGPMLILFADNAVFEFEDQRIGSFEGIETITGVFRRQAPSTKLSISQIAENDGIASADYANENRPNIRLGSLTLKPEGDKINHLYIAK